MQPVGNLADAEAGRGEQMGSLHDKQLVDVVDHGAPRHLADNPREVIGGDVQLRSVKSDVVMFGKMVG